MLILCVLGKTRPLWCCFFIFEKHQLDQLISENLYTLENVPFRWNSQFLTFSGIDVFSVFFVISEDDRNIGGGAVSI